MVSCTLYDASGQRANSETQVIVDNHALHEYVLKYESKAEKKSAGFVAACATLLRNMERGAGCERFAPVDALLGRLVNLSIKEWDIGAVETCHLNLGYPLVECTENFRNVSYEEMAPLQVDNEARYTGKSAVGGAMEGAPMSWRT